MILRHGKKKLLPIVGIFLVTAMLLLTGRATKAEPKKFKLGDIPLSSEEYEKRLKKIPRDMMSTIETALPSVYDARAFEYVTDAKNQGSCGSCWAFASAGAFESHLLKAGFATTNPDHAEQQQVSCNESMWGCQGGNSNALLYWGDKGPQGEADFPYTANDTTPCIEDNQQGYRVTNYHTVPATTAGFKESLYNDGPSYWRYAVYSDFYTFWNNSSPGAVYVNRSDSYEGGHAVLLIGWDDAKNAFLCKNSWGTGGPNGDGTFWIAYDGHDNDLGFGMANFSVVSLTPTCGLNSDCDDGIYCNGMETCVNGTCQPGSPVSCPDDGNFCNGSEYCDETYKGCNSTDSPCSEGENCQEDSNLCVPETCDNDICDEGEDCINCSSDCISGSGGGDCASCFKGDCDGRCSPAKDGADCPDCAPSFCCGDGVCNGDEDSIHCPLDCGDPEDCSDGMDNDGDGLADCNDPDCFGIGECTVEICDDKIDNDGDGQTDCADSDCYGNTACPSCKMRKELCSSDDECCSKKCFRGACK